MAIVLVEQYFDFAYDLADRFYVCTEFGRVPPPRHRSCSLQVQ
jgi:ABC-type branched-subunit amino acid transport system ATPase component